MRDSLQSHDNRSIWQPTCGCLLALRTLTTKDPSLKTQQSAVAFLDLSAEIFGSSQFGIFVREWTLENTAIIPCATMNRLPVFIPQSYILIRLIQCAYWVVCRLFFCQEHIQVVFGHAGTSDCIFFLGSFLWNWAMVISMVSARNSALTHNK